MAATQKIPNIQEPFISRQQASRLAGLSIRTIDSLLASGQLRSYRLGRRRVLIDPADVRRLIRPRSAPGPSLFDASERVAGGSR
jgi:excisionase family DNA binding protein